MPFFDPDTNLLFLCGKGDSSVNILEARPDEITQASHAMLPDQTKGMSMAPKVCLDVMGCEVDRLLQLCSRQIVPVRIEVPRRSKIDFAAELFPDTDSDDIVLTSDSWFEGQNAKRLKTSLDPSRRKSLRSDDESGNDVSKTSSPVKNSASEHVERVAAPAVKKEEVQKSKAVESKPELKPRPAAKPFPGVRQCKFRHWTGTVLHPSTHITAITKLSHTIPGGSDGFHANDRYAAVPLTTPGGHVGIIELAKVGRITGDVPSFENTSPVTDFRWNPFDDRQLAVGLDDGLVKIWQVPDEGLSGTLSEPVQVLGGHYSKILCMRYHPLASNLLATASLDMNVLIWNVENDEPALELGGHSEEVLAMEWSTDGKYLATVSKDSKIRIYDPRNSSSPIKEGPGPKGSRGARIVWTCADKMLFVSGFSGMGGRSLSIHSVDDLTKGPLADVNMDNSPATLIPHYDEDSATVFLAGRGDALMYSYEISSEDPYLTQLATFKSDQVYQGFSFLSKLRPDPRQVEFARAWRLSKTSLEPISFKVPRVKMEYFQDDLFPDTRETGAPTMTADGWLSGKNMLPRLISLKPAGMKPLSQAPKEEPKERKYESYNPDTYKTDEEKKEELLAAMSNKLDLDKALEQDTMEGVDEDEWDD
ncbi:unnamed protein product [Clavelina lepadiformis]|uniref:Coronin n=1 Tax=Clavelina lepadiformis TaxID=159417 RepID=A0ABP0FXM4_CLALP